MDSTPESSKLSVLCFIFQGLQEYALVEQKTRRGMHSYYVTLFNDELYALLMTPLIIRGNGVTTYRKKNITPLAEAVCDALFFKDPQASSS